MVTTQVRGNDDKEEGGRDERKGEEELIDRRRGSKRWEKR